MVETAWKTRLVCARVCVCACVRACVYFYVCLILLIKLPPHCKLFIYSTARFFIRAGRHKNQEGLGKDILEPYQLRFQKVTESALQSFKISNASIFSGSCFLDLKY